MAINTDDPAIEVLKCAGESFGKLLESGEYSDMVLEFEGRTWKVHRFVLCSRSPVFHAAVEGRFSEARTGTVKVQAPSATEAAITHMLHFLYSHCYDIIEYTGHYQNDNYAMLIANVLVHGLACYYQIPELKRMANYKIGALLPDLALEKLADVVAQAYEHSDDKDELRHIITAHVTSNQHTVTSDHSLMTELANTPDFMIDLPKALVKHADEGPVKELENLRKRLTDNFLLRYCTWCKMDQLAKIETVHQRDTSTFYVNCPHCENMMRY